MARPVRALTISASQQHELQSMGRRPQAPQREVRRAKIILARAEGHSQQQTADLVGINRPVVAKGEKRFMQHSIAGLAGAKRSGRKPAIAAQTRAAIITETTTLPPGRARWSSRGMAKAKGVSTHGVQCLWRANDIKLHAKRYFTTVLQDGFSWSGKGGWC